MADPFGALDDPFGALDEPVPPNPMTIKKWFTEAPEWLRQAIASLTPVKGISWEEDSDGMDISHVHVVRGEVPRHLADAEAFCSRTRGENHHLLVLDLDGNAALIPSSTPGHHHLVLEPSLSEEDWREVITVLAKHGIIEDNYAQASLNQGGTYIRAPWIRKGCEERDRIAAYSEWIDAEDDFTDAATRRFSPNPDRGSPF